MNTVITSFSGLRRCELWFGAIVLAAVACAFMQADPQLPGAPALQAGGPPPCQGIEMARPTLTCGT